MLRPYTFRTVNDMAHLVMTAREWELRGGDHSDYNGIVSADSRLHTEFDWPVGTRTTLHYDNGTCLVPVIIEG